MTGLDPFTVEVIGSAFASIVEEMGETLVRASHSTNIKERRDCSTALLDPAGELLCQAEHIPMHLGSFLGIVPHILRNYAPDEIGPGDCFIANDPFQGGGTHLPDILLAEPVFVDEALVAWAVNTGHHADFVDRAHAHIYQEGLRISPTRIYRRGVLQEDLQRLILLNCQVPDERLSDLRAQIGANRVGVERVTALCCKYGSAIVRAAGEALQDYAERRMRAGIAAIPDGVYDFEDRLDTAETEGELDLSVRITVRGDEMALQFDSPPQIRASLNVTREALLASVYFAVKAVVDPTIPPNAGLARPLTVTAPPGTLLHCAHPAAVNGRLQPCQRVVDLILGALAQAVPDRVPAAGNGACASVTFVGTHEEDGRTWIYLEAIGGGAGARPHKDGLDGVHVHMTNTSNLPIEALEVEYPVTVLRYELIADSGGAGTYRGGRGIARLFRAEADCRVRAGGSRMLSRPWGLAGGGPGRGGEIVPGPGTAPFVRGAGVLRAGETIEIRTPGGGGHGAAKLRNH